MVQSRLDEARKALLANLIETYLPLGAAEEAEFERLVAQPEAKEVRDMITIYEQRGIEKGIEQGIEQGILRGKKDTLLHLMQSKFGELPVTIVAKVRSLSSVEDVNSLTDRILSAASLEQMGLTEE